MSVVGIDGCKRGWIAIALDDDGSTRDLFVEHLDDLGITLDGVHAVAIDTPVGLPSTGRRRADDAARELLGARRNSVFYAPVRDAITAATHAEASAISRRVTGHGISRQSFALRRRSSRPSGGQRRRQCPSGRSTRKRRSRSCSAIPPSTPSSRGLDLT